ncbi:MAG TPA: methyltransferase [Gemmatimonadales bacterium]|nr:methyltransferase [Gemmatimonadales bacterium]
MSHSTPAALIELATAHRRSRALAALIALEIPTRLGARARSRESLAQELNAEPAAIGALLEAAVALGVLARRDGGYANTEAAASYLRRDAPGYLGEWFMRHDRMAHALAWNELPRRLCAWRGGEPAAFAPESAPTAADREGQHQMALLAGDALADAVELGSFHRLLDLGGGTGGMAIALCRRHPHLNAAVIERADVAPLARDAIRRAGLDARIEVRAGDFLDAAPWPSGADLVLLANVLSMLPARRARELFGRIGAYLPPGGCVIVSGWMPGAAEGDGLAPALQSLEDIALGAPDVERPAADYAAWLTEAGFGDVATLAYFPPTSLVMGHKPAARRVAGSLAAG